jgi:CXXC-20-CXXC protein
MKKQKCKLCDHYLEWKKIYASLWFPHRTIQCSKCESKHIIMSSSHKYISLFIIISMLALGIIINHIISSFPISMVVGLPSIIIFGLLISLFMPFFVKYSIE